VKTPPDRHVFLPSFVHELKNGLRWHREAEPRMEPNQTSALEERWTQSRVFKRLALRKLQLRKLQEGQEQRDVYATIASEFMNLPSLDNVDRLSTLYGYSRVRRAISLLDNLIFEEFFYGKLYLYPLWIKQFTRLLDAARPRAIVKELMSSQE
jgi:hypothetical protein